LEKILKERRAVLSYSRGLLFRNIEAQSLQTRREELDFMGASLSSSSGRDLRHAPFQVKKDLRKGWDLFMEVLTTRPLFREEKSRGS